MVFSKMMEFKKQEFIVAHDRTKQEREQRRNLILQSASLEKIGNQVDNTGQQNRRGWRGDGQPGGGRLHSKRQA